MSPKKIDKAARERQILDAAAAVFARRGFRAATMDEVAAAAGVAKGTLYLSYSSKEDLFFALFAAFADEAMAAPPALPAGTAPDQVIGLLVEIGTRLDRDSLLVPLTLEFWSAAGVEATRARFADRYAAMLDAFRGALVGILRGGEARGEVRRGLPLDAIVSSLLATIDGLIVQAWVDRDLSIAETLRAALPPLLDGIRPAGSAAPPPR